MSIENLPIKGIRVIEKDAMKVDSKLFIKRQALPEHYDELITDSCVVIDNGEPRVVYIDLDAIGEDSTSLVKVLQQIPLNMFARGQRRANGMQSETVTVGWQPRKALRHDYCHLSKLGSIHPELHNEIVRYAQQVSTWYQRFNPELYNQHASITQEKISDDYKLPRTVFTSGVINRNNSIPYHFDAGNFKDVWSCMLAFKNKTEGGYLSCPEYRIGFEIKNNSLLMFDGQSLIHGVTPIKLLTNKSYRYTIVYYSLQQMWNCLPITEELARIRAVKAQREMRRADLIAGRGTLEELYPQVAKKKKEAK